MIRPAISFALCLLIAAAAPAGGPPGACEPGYRWVEEDSYTEVVRHVCKVVPGVKKQKQVNYSTRDDPFCLRLFSLKALFGAKAGCPDDCGETCTGPHDRRILVKTVVTREEPTTKCVTEKVTEKVPCKVWRKVPCAAPSEQPR